MYVVIKSEGERASWVQTEIGLRCVAGWLDRLGKLAAFFWSGHGLIPSVKGWAINWTPWLAGEGKEGGGGTGLNWTYL